jgi:hypothetical protein
MTADSFYNLAMSFFIQIIGSLSVQFTVGTLQVKYDLHKTKTYVYRISLIAHGSRTCPWHKM